MNYLAALQEKNIFRTDKNNTHSYIDYFYEKEFLKYKNKNITLIEIGVQYGGSIRLWDSYFENATIYGIDTELYSKGFQDFCNSKPNIQYILGDAYNENFVKDIPNFDIFIDDGPHNFESQMKAIELYLPKLNSGGVFIIEDIQDHNHLPVLKNYAKSLYDGYTYELIDLRIVKYRYDDLLLVIRK